MLLARNARDAPVRGEAAGQHLDRDLALQLGVGRAPDLAHSAGAELGDELEGPRRAPINGFPGQRLQLPEPVCLDVDFVARHLTGKQNEEEQAPAVGGHLEAHGRSRHARRLEEALRGLDLESAALRMANCHQAAILDEEQLARRARPARGMDARPTSVDLPCRGTQSVESIARAVSEPSSIGRQAGIRVVEGVATRLRRSAGASSGSGQVRTGLLGVPLKDDRAPVGRPFIRLSSRSPAIRGSAGREASTALHQRS